MRTTLKYCLGFLYSLSRQRKITFGLSFHPGSRFERGPGASIGKLQLRGKLQIGAGTKVLDGAVFNDKITIGRHTRVGRNFSCHGNVEIGNYCAIAQDCFVISTSHRTDLPALQVDFQRRLFPEFDLEVRGNVVIGHNVWLGRSATILPNVTVGNGAVIGASSVVTKDVPPYTVVAGNPARKIKKRFPPDVIEKIEASQWFKKEPKDLAQHHNFFAGDDFDSFA